MAGPYTIQTQFGEPEGPAKRRHLAIETAETLSEAAAKFNLAGSLNQHAGIALFAPNGLLLASRGEGPALELKTKGTLDADQGGG